MEVRLNIDDAFVKKLQEKVGRTVSAYDLTRDALTLFNWAVHEIAAGRVIVSTNATGEDVQRPVMPTLMQVEAKAKQLSATQAAITAADEQGTARIFQAFDGSGPEQRPERPAGRATVRPASSDETP